MTKTFKDVKGIEEACWVGYKQVGMKKKGNRQVPNCVPESVVNALFGKDYIYEVSESVADMYADNIKKQGGQVFSNKLEKIPYKVVDKK